MKTQKIVIIISCLWAGLSVSKNVYVKINSSKAMFCYAFHLWEDKVKFPANFSYIVLVYVYVQLIEKFDGAHSISSPIFCLKNSSAFNSFLK